MVAKRYLNSPKTSEQILGVIAAGTLQNLNEENKQVFLTQFYFTGSPLIKALTIQTVSKFVKAETRKAQLLESFAEFEDDLPLRRVLVLQADALHKFRNKIDLLKYFLVDLDPSIVATANTKLEMIEHHIPALLRVLKEPCKQEHLKKTQQILKNVFVEYDQFAKQQQSFFNLKKSLSKQVSSNALESIQATRRSIWTSLKSKNNLAKYPLLHRFLQKLRPEIHELVWQAKEAKKKEASFTKNDI